MTASIYPQAKALSLNPVILHIEDDSEGYVPFSVLVPVSVSGSGAVQLGRIYDGQVYLSEATGMAADINLAEVIDTLFIGQIVPHTQEGIIASRASLSRHVYFWVGTGSNTISLDIEVYHGGVSRQLFYELRQAGTDIFQARFLNYNGNFFFSAVDTSWQVIRRETELMPLFFIMPEGGITLTAHGTSQAWESGTDYEGGLVSIDIQKLRRHFFNTYGILPSLFDVAAATDNICQIAVEQAQPSKNTVTARYLTSLGTWEKMVLTDNPQIGYSIGNEDNNDTYKVFDTVTQDFVDSRTRRDAVNTINATTSHLLPRQRRALLEMLQSDCVYVAVDGAPEQAALAAIDELAWQHRKDGPERFNISFTPIRSGNIPWLYERPGIFTPQFTPPFV